jgi:hypothetical protein
VLEILQGSRSDLALREKLAPVLAKIETNARATLTREFPGGVSSPLLTLIVGLVRGLSIMQVLTPEGENVEDAITLLQELLKAGIGSGILSGKSHRQTGKATRVPAGKAPVRKAPMAKASTGKAPAAKARALKAAAAKAPTAKPASAKAPVAKIPAAKAPAKKASTAKAAKAPAAKAAKAPTAEASAKVESTRKRPVKA